MSEHSKIEWTDAAWNVVIGCDKVSPGCDNCYAIRTATRMQANPNPKISGPYEGTATDGEWTGRVNFVDHRLGDPLRWTKPKRIFVNAQSDLFHADISDAQIASVWAVMAAAQQHTFQVLTKRPARMRSLLSRASWLLEVARAGVDIGLDERSIYDRNWPLPNVHLGVSVEDQKRADLRVPALLDTPAAVRFLSCEPLLGEVSMFANTRIDTGTLVDWVIVGGESGPDARPMHPTWARGLRDECTHHGIPFHFKQWGEWVPEDQSPEDTVIPSPCRWDASTGAYRLGKARTGRLLDGRTWDEQPQAVNA